MKKQDKYRERLEDKTALFLKVSFIGTICCLILAALCFFLLDITEIIPWILVGFAGLNFINLYAFRRHKNLTLAYNITALTALSGSIAIVLYSGGINSPFIFILAVLVFAGYVTTRVYGRIYLAISLLFLLLIYAASSTDYSWSDNVVPEDSQALFSLFSIMLSVYLLGGVFGKNLLSAHHKLYRSKGEIEQRMQEKEMLLKEVHHRVKNNLQTVSSLLRMQSREVDDAHIQNLLLGSQNRVVCMAMVHEMLYMREDLAKIEYRSYVEDLGAYLIKSVKGPKSKIRLNIDIPDIELGIDTAIPLGLLINEAVTNALKYGFKDLDEGEITIALEQENKTEYILRIGDNGVGFPEEITPASTKSLGLKLIHNLSRQLKGNVIRDFSKKGTNYIIHFQEAAQAPFHTLA